MNDRSVRIAILQNQPCATVPHREGAARKDRANLRSLRGRHLNEIRRLRDAVSGTRRNQNCWKRDPMNFPPAAPT